MFELKVMEPAAFKFDYIATQAGQSSAGMPENGCRTRRGEEAESLGEELQRSSGQKLKDVLAIMQ